MASNTTNLALYKKNPTTDGADTFNITTMLNDNWDKIDALPGTATPVIDGVAAVGVSTKYSREDHKHPTDTTRAPVASPTFTGAVTLPADPTASLGAATKQYVDNLPRNVTQQAIINGGFLVNQRVVSGTVTLAAGQYGHDRWKAGAGGCTYTFATTANVTTVTISAGSLVQVIEGINLISGTYTLSWTGTAQGKIGAGSYSASGVAGTATGGTNLSIEFNTGSISKVQLNAGNQLPFQPRSFAEELALCQRYYQRLDSAIGGRAEIGVGAAINTTQIWSVVNFKAQMRVLPTLVTSGIFRTLPGGANVTLSIPDGSLFGCGIIATSSGLALNQAYVIQAADGGTAWVAFDAEL